MQAAKNSLVASALIAAVLLYRNILRPLLLPTCRFVPGCSEYAVASLRKYGAFRGGLLAGRRVLRCHPLGRKGYDPVP